ncbi:ATP-binding protein [Streptomyces sp. NBC_00481]|uniref:ATP-binding protein n=1 Tax=Streptomyces sp. NBC_00481 TaxID=2975755 RepID=UPI002DD94E3D|nr:ATP-binding protein [Streptomyces sp. NBC_00481]WRY98747.1 ATP-binding protein [Streptomyces sp. NBC_00481]
MSEGLVLRMEFDVPELPLVRALVEEAALRARLATAVKGAVVQASLEICTNTLPRGDGSGVIELRLMEGELRCEVTAVGPTAAGRPTPAAGRPDPRAGRPEGHGIRLAESLIAGLGTPGRIGLHSVPRGTTVTLSVPLPASGCPPPGYSPARALNQAAT